MKRDAFLLFFAGVLVTAGCVLGYMLLTKKVATPSYSNDTPHTVRSSNIENDFVEVPVLTFITEKNSDPVQKYTWDISYPSISLMGHGNLAKEANTVIKTYAMDLLQDFQKNIADGEPLDGVNDLTPTSDFTMRSNAVLLSPTIISLRFDTAEYVAGSAHPNQQIHMLNYDIETKRVVPTEDLFATSSDALAFLSTYSQKILTERFVDASKEEIGNTLIPGTSPVADNFRSVGITKDGLIVTFDPYQVASYARGSHEVRIPLRDVSPQLSPRVLRAIELANVNFTEATPED